MTYIPGIPQDTPPPAEIAAQIRQNFTTFGTSFAADHSAMNSRNQGKHEATYMQSQSVDPDITGDFVGVFAKVVLSAAGPFEALFAKIPQFLPNDEPNTPQQLTYFTTNTAGPIYQSFLPGGYVLYLGSTTTNPTVINLSPVPSELLCVIAQSNTMTTAGDQIAVDVSVTPTPGNPAQFTINSAIAGTASALTFRFSWLAIARQ